MAKKVTFTYEQAVEEVFLGDSNSPVINVLEGQWNGNLIDFNSPEVRDTSHLKSEILHFLVNREDYQDYQIEYNVLRMLFNARDEAHDNVESIKKLMLTLHRITDERLKYNVLDKLARKVYSNDCKTIGHTAIKMRANNKYATLNDLIALLRISEPAERRTIITDIEKGTIDAINNCLNARVPAIEKISTLIHDLKQCAELTYGKDSESYTKICQMYDEAKLLTPQFQAYVPSISDVDKRTIDALIQENALLRGRVDALESEVTSSKAYAEKCEDATATLVLAIQNTRASVFSRGVNAAKAQAEHVLGNLRKTR